MDNDGYRSAGEMPRPVLSRAMRAGIVSVELVLVGLIAILLADFTFKMLAAEPQQQPLTAQAPQPETAVDTSVLLSFDPFFRASSVPEAQAQARLPESTLNIQVFGLRARADGSGSAIIKLQDGEQKLAQVGDTIASGVQLTAVYPDRLELRRAGVKEAVYLRPQQERTDAERPATAAVQQQEAPTRVELFGQAFANLGLTPVRRDRRIIGFKLPDAVPLLLSGTELEGGDILVRANGFPLSSFERLQEISETMPGTGSLLLEIERRGQMREVTVNLEGNR